MSPAAPSVNPFARRALPRGLLRWLPALRLLRTYQRAWLAKDVFAGLVLTAVLVPVGSKDLSMDRTLFISENRGDFGMGGDQWCSSQSRSPPR